MRVKNLEKLGETIDTILEYALDKAGEYLADAMHDTIEYQHQSWIPLKPATIRRKGHDKILIDTGELMESIDHKQQEDFVKVGVFGKRAYIGAVHEFGAPSRNIPERSFIRSTFKDEKKKIEKMIEDTVKQSIRRFTIK